MPANTKYGNCPNCAASMDGKTISAFSKKPVKPEADTLALCMTCGEPVVWLDEYTVRTMTAAELTTYVINYNDEAELMIRMFWQKRSAYQRLTGTDNDSKH